MSIPSLHTNQDGDEMEKKYTDSDIQEIIEREVRKRIREEKEKMERNYKIIRRGFYEPTPEEEQIRFFLNFELAQCASKTEKAIQTIALNHYKNKQKYKFVGQHGQLDMSGQHVKLISIVFTNNSLLEGKAWKSRTAAIFDNVDIVVQRLASDTKKNEKDFSRGLELLATFSTFAGKEDNKRQLGDVLIMCNHHVRINDMIEVMDTHSGLRSTHGVNFKYNIFFDEPDESNCLTNMMKFIKTIYAKNLSYFIDEIQLITATPAPEMLRRLKNITPDADKLLNLKNKLPEQIIEEKKDYRTIIDQEYFPFEGPKNPTDYIDDLYNKNPGIFVPGKVYFIPSHHYCSGHEEMANLKIFQDNGYWILILNGQCKQFRSPLGEIIDIMPDLKNGGELRDILRSWRQKYPTSGLVITGKMVLERGLTFITDGFNFDYMIISSYFAKDICTLVQICGRGQGKKQFVDDFKVIMPQALYDEVKKYIEDSEKLIENNPEFYDLNMLSNLGKADEFKNVEEPHYESTIEKLYQWVKDNIYKKDGKPASLRVKMWKNKNKNTDGFIMHKFGESEEKVWSEEEALKQRGGITPYSRRIFPCYTSLDDVTTLKWYIFYRND